MVQPRSIIAISDNSGARVARVVKLLGGTRKRYGRLGDVQTRVIGVDERMGIVWLRMAWGARQEGGEQLTVWESFKVYDGQIHAVEAFMRTFPIELRNGGWEG